MHGFGTHRRVSIVHLITGSFDVRLIFSFAQLVFGAFIQ